jgi:hypothetical protein
MRLVAAVLLMSCVVQGVVREAFGQQLAPPSCVAAGLVGRACLVSSLRAAANKLVSPDDRARGLGRIADMEIADGRVEAAKATLHAATAAAFEVESQISRATILDAIVMRRAALGEAAAVEADAVRFTAPYARALYLMSYLKALSPGASESEMRRVIELISAAADATLHGDGAGSGDPRGGRWSYQAYRLLPRALADAGRDDLALEQPQGEPDDIVMARLKKGSLPEVEELMSRFGMEESQAVAEDLINRRHDYRAAVDFIERHPHATPGPELDTLLARAKLRTGDLDGALKLAETGDGDPYTWGDVWSDIATAQAKAGQLKQAIVSNGNVPDTFQAATRSAIASALFREGRKAEAADLVRKAYAAIVDAGEFGQRAASAQVAEALLTVSGVADSFGFLTTQCGLPVALDMLRQEHASGRTTNASKILVATDRLVERCLDKPVMELDLSDVGQFVCTLAELKGAADALSRLKALEGRIADAGLWDYWDPLVRYRVYECLASSMVRAREVARAWAFADSAPRPDLAIGSLQGIAEAELTRDPGVAASAVDAIMSKADPVPGAIDEILYVTPCLYGDRRDIVQPMPGQTCALH